MTRTASSSSGWPFKKASIDNPLVIWNEGDKAIKYLLGTDVLAHRKIPSLPCLVLLDIKLPKISGFEVLELIRKTPALKTLPVVILTNSPHPADILKARELGADHYLVKPFDVEKLALMMKLVFDRFVLAQSRVAVKTATGQDEHRKPIDQTVFDCR